MRSCSGRVALALSGCLAALHVAAPARADDYYKGKTISVVIGAKGGSLLLGAQLVANHLGRHMPGRPTVISVQMPGGAHLVATNQVFNVADSEGLTILAANPNVAVAQLSKTPQVRFDLRKFQWLGSLGPDGAMLSIRADLPYKTWDEFKASGKQLLVGSTGTGSNAHDMPMLLKEFAGANFKFVTGYVDNSEILLAAERKEVDVWAALATTVKHGIERGAVRAIVRARAPVAGYNDLPIDETLTSDPIGKALMAIRGIPLQLGRVFAVRPGVPADRVAILRKAFEEMTKDPAFVADAAKPEIDIAYGSPQEVAKGFDEVLAQPPAVLDAVKKYLQPG